MNSDTQDQTQKPTKYVEQKIAFWEDYERKMSEKNIIPPKKSQNLPVSQSVESMQLNNQNEPAELGQPTEPDMLSYLNQLPTTAKITVATLLEKLENGTIKFGNCTEKKWTEDQKKKFIEDLYSGQDCGNFKFTI